MLAYLCKAGIRMYWYLIPKEKRIVCLYKDHCSQHVYNALNANGFFAGMRAFLVRYKNCNNNYSFYMKEGQLFIKTSGGQLLDEEIASPIVVKGCISALKDIDK